MSMNTQDIKTLISILEESGLESLSYKAEGVEISLSKGFMTTRLPEPSGNVPSAAPIPQEDHSVLRSPLVGIFYARPAPDKDPYVKIGSTVKKGDVLCVIEAMKVMNEIRATAAGVVRKIHVDDAAMVEYDQALFSIE